jgi:ATPase subunit of ABC transporter with duplicated ATPase domains
MLSVSNLGKFFGPQALFRGVTFQLNPGRRYGLVGANGSGKSTLMKILAGKEPPSEGEISVPRRARLGVLEQDHFRYEHNRILDVVVMGRPEVWEAMEEKEKLLAAADFDSDRYAEVEEVILANDGYALEAKAGEILEGLGIPTVQHALPLSTLSGGFKLRVLLAKVLAGDPDVLLLDEPTNHLDILSIRWLETFLQSFAGVALVISHDHRFLDNVCTDILDVDYETVIEYPGNYTAFEQQKVAERERKEIEINRREKEIENLQAFVDRFRAKATKARQAQSRAKQIEKIQIDRLPQTSRRYPRFQLKSIRPPGRMVLELEGISKAYGNRKVLDGVSLTVDRDDKIAIIGPNGIGKSTLLKIAMGQVQADAGKVTWGYETYPGYFAQDHKEALGEARGTVESWLWDICPGEPIGFVRGTLGAVLFDQDDVQKRLSSLSGGEAARLVFAKLSVVKPNVLVLDEPTNHLDLEAIEALIQALEKYDGTLLFVSHDRYFVSRLATRIIEISANGINDFRGTWEEYLEHCHDDHLDAQQVILRARREKRKEKERAEPISDADRKAQAKKRKQLEQRRDEITAELERIEARVHEINEKFCNPGFFDRTEPGEVKKLEGEQKRLGEKSAALMEEWERVEGELAEMGE